MPTKEEKAYDCFDKCLQNYIIASYNIPPLEVNVLRPPVTDPKNAYLFCLKWCINRER
jgi:hypothetical protein